MKKYVLVLSLLFMPFLSLAQFGDLDPATAAQLSNLLQQSMGQSNGSPQMPTPGNLPTFNPGVTIVTSPRIPEPNSIVNISLDDYAVKSDGADITWFIDGTENVSAKNQRSFDLETKGLGETTVVDVRLSEDGLTIFSQTRAITPARVDLILEADTLTPAFYPGRPLPSVGSMARVVVLPQTGGPDDPADYSYTYKLDNQVLYGGPLKGVNVATFEVGLGRNQIFSVDVTDTTGSVIAHKGIYIPQTDPELHFYAENPLRGIVPKSITNTYILTGDEVTMRAEPYYIDKNLLANNPHIKWTVNGITTNNPSRDPQNITLRQASGIGQAVVSFEIRNLKQLVQGVKDSFTVQF